MLPDQTEDSSDRNSAAKCCRLKTEEIVFAIVEWDCSQLGESFVVAAVVVVVVVVETTLMSVTSLARKVEREKV